MGEQIKNYIETGRPWLRLRGCLFVPPPPLPVVVLRQPARRKAGWDYSTWLADMRQREDVVVRGQRNEPLPPRLGFMCGNVAELRCYNGAQKCWLVEENCGPEMLAITMLQSAWSDAAWIEKGRRCLGGQLRQNPETARKRAYRADDRLSRIAFFCAPPAPSAWGGVPTIEGWCDLLGPDAGICRRTVEAHLRALSPVHGELVDYVQADIVELAARPWIRRCDPP